MDQGPRSIRYPHETAPEFGVPVEVADGVMWLRLPLPMALDHVNIYALDDGDSWTLVDTGLAWPRGQAMLDAALEGPLGGKPVARVLVTHHHPDHIGLAGGFQARGAELLTTRTAYLMARMLSLDVQERPVPEALEFYRSAGAAPEVMEQRARERPFNFADVIAPLALGYTRITEGDRLRIGGRTWRVRIGHGHAPEHATLWSEDDDLILGGDQLLPSISPNLGVYPTEPGADPVADWLASCRAFQPLAREEHFVLPGHKLPFAGLPTRLEQMIENHISALDRLESHLATPAAAGDCFLPIFKRQIGGGEYGLALVEAVAHCQHLYLAGRARRVRRDDGAWLYEKK
ncbi:MAG: MBL fold metallo-hydrolase [Silicimonas sp.]|jgi:glyoxylase-like metal-dependent hydrolase (beta-lactamase superfamily II)|nr:MBL fold metallo-hydrolase [Silicimonas sp.]